MTCPHKGKWRARICKAAFDIFIHFQNSANLPNWPKLLSLLMNIYCPVVWTARKAILNTGGMNKTFLYFTCDSGRLPSGQISRQGDTHNQDWAKAKGQSLEREKVTDINRHIMIEDILSWSCTSTSTLSTWRRNWLTTPPFHPTTRCINMPMICCWWFHHAWEESLLHHDVLPRLIDAVLCPEGPEMHFIRTWKERCHWAKLCLHRIETNELEFFRHHVQWSKTEGMPKFQLQITMAQAFVAWVYISIVRFGLDWTFPFWMNFAFSLFFFLSLFKSSCTVVFFWTFQRFVLRHGFTQ